jgi:hypothetical protein
MESWYDWTTKERMLDYLGKTVRIFFSIVMSLTTQSLRLHRIAKMMRLAMTHKSLLFEKYEQVEDWVTR